MWATIWKVLLELWSICVLAAIICRSQWCTSRGRMRRPSSPSGTVLSVRVASHWPLPLIWWIFDQCIYWTVCCIFACAESCDWRRVCFELSLLSTTSLPPLGLAKCVPWNRQWVKVRRMLVQYAICVVSFLPLPFFIFSMGYTRHRPSATKSTISRHALRMMPMLSSFYFFFGVGAFSTWTTTNANGKLIYRQCLQTFFSPSWHLPLCHYNRHSLCISLSHNVFIFAIIFVSSLRFLSCGANCLCLCLFLCGFALCIDCWALLLSLLFHTHILL